MTQPVLIVEDDPLQQEMLKTLLRRKLDFGAQCAGHGRAALDILEADTDNTIKLVILDLEMPVMGGLETLQIITAQYPALPVIMLTGSKDIDTAVTAMKFGAVDFLTKPYEGDRMAVTVKNALKMSLLSKEVKRLQNQNNGTFRFENLIGFDKGLQPVINAGRKAANSDIPLLITGETGTGKEVFARAIHGESARSGKPFIAVNCGAIPAQLVESTLFGHEKGAFTGATEKTIGKFREADGGTIFLDEVGELPLDTQVKLLRVLQQKEVEPVGGGKPLTVNVRVLSATNRDLATEVKEGWFRQDLFFRLNVLQIELPPLRHRKSDIPALTQHFIERFCAAEGGVPKEISPVMYQTLLDYEWPGNVRQLENAINSAMVMSDGAVLDIDDFSKIVGSRNTAHDPRQSATFGQSPAPHDIRVVGDGGTFKTAEEIEQAAIEIALAVHDHNVTKAAQALGMAKSTFYKKMKTL
ncbi:MAG: sigma-54-dependent transcriptional regulator [Bdellovibrionales bacterium]